MKIALIGYGKMGQMIESVAQQRGHEIVCIIDKTAESGEPRDESGEPRDESGEPRVESGELRAERDCQILRPKEGFASAVFRSADVAIEFSRPDAAEQNIREALKQGVAVVSGTTGWDVEKLKAEIKNQESEIRNQKSEIGCPGVIWSSNYSIGVNVLFAVNRYLARLLQHTSGYTPSITEIHHVHKLDAPSGTAKTLAEDIVDSHEQRGERREQCPITSIREGEVPGIHEVRWESEADILTLKHEAKSRRGFALGAVMAAEWLKGKQGWHELEEALQIR